jgi:hypothetical protein
MAIFTPRGLKIRLDIPLAFALMSRLYPKFSAFKILKTTEGIDLLPNSIAFTTAIICFLTNVEPISLVYYVLIIYLLIHIMLMVGFIIPGLDFYGTLFSYVSGFGIYFLIIL